MPNQKLLQAGRKLKFVAIAAFFVIAAITATRLNFYGASADVLLHEQSRQMLGEKLIFDLSRKIDPIRKRVEAGVQGIKLADGVAFNADVKSLDVSDIHIGSDGIGIFFTAKGASNITVIPSIK